MRISILGCGWLGRPLADALREQKHALRVSTTREQRYRELRRDGFEVHRIQLVPGLEGEIDDFFEADALVITVPPDRLAPQAYPEQIAAAARASSGIEQILFTSSTSVYPSRDGIVTEYDAGDEPPERASGRAVLGAERRLQTLRPDATVLRLGGLYGYDRQPGRFLAGRRDLPGADAPVNLLHRDDAVGALLTVLELRLPGEVLNVVADRHPTREPFYRAAAERLGLEPPTFTDEPIPWKIVSNARFKRLTGYRFLHPDPAQPAP